MRRIRRDVLELWRDLSRDVQSVLRQRDRSRELQTLGRAEIEVEMNVWSLSDADGEAIERELRYPFDEAKICPECGSAMIVTLDRGDPTWGCEECGIE